jgi:PBSX family phage terminase large subunit
MKPSKAQAAALLWRRGVLLWKLDKVQKELYDAYQHATGRVVVWKCSRRLGKSYALCILAVETCLKKPNSIVKYVAPKQKMVKTIIKPIIQQIIADCPEDLLPEFKTMDNVWRFKNGSEIHLAGTDGGHADSLRGGASDLCLVDEAGFCDELKDVVQSVLIPTTLTTGGKIVLSSTPAKSPGHDFSKYVERAEKDGTLIIKTIYDNPRLTRKQIQDIIDEYGGVDDVEFRREFLCEEIIDETAAVVPEFSNVIRVEEWRNEIIADPPRPRYFDRYVSADIGFNDFTVVLFGYYDFLRAKIVIEDEIVLNGPKMTTKHLADSIKSKETDLYTNLISGDVKAAYMRVSDNNLILINDLHRLHGLAFLPTKKDNKEAQVNEMRQMIQSRKIVISPRCKTLIRHLKHATWNKARKEYVRSEDDGHYDAVDALLYFVRNVIPSKNPYPANWDRTAGTWFVPTTALKPVQSATPTTQHLTKIFKVKKSNR